MQLPKIASGTIEISYDYLFAMECAENIEDLLETDYLKEVHDGCVFRDTPAIRLLAGIDASPLLEVED